MITQEFFETQGKVLDDYHKKGYLALDEFITESKVTLNQLTAFGLIQQKQIVSTADSHHLTVTENGRKYFKELVRVQLILIPNKNKEKLVQFVNSK